MTDEQNLRDDLLNQNGHNSPPPSALSEQVLARDERQVKRLNRVAIAGWILFLASVVIAVAIEAMAKPPHDYFVPAAIMIVQGLLVIVVILSISLHVRSRTLTMHQIQVRLARIEEQLRVLSK